MTLDQALRRMPLIAVLRGIAPEEAEPVGDALVEAGFLVMEATLDSPSPYDAIATLAKRHGDRVLVGAGTVLRPEEVGRVAEAGGRLIVSPNFSPPVVEETRRLGLISAPGVMTPTEAFAALDAGADALKLFPGDAVRPKVVKALAAVLPKGTAMAVTGGVDADTIPDFLAAGALGVGLGSALFKPGKPAAEVAADAARFVEWARRARG